MSNHRLPRVSLAMATVLLTTSVASAQGLNVDFESTFGTPTSAYAAGSGQAGVWNPVAAAVPLGPTVLADVNGAPTGVTLRVAAGPNGYNGLGAYNHDNPNTSGDDEALMDDILDVGGGFVIAPSGVELTFSGLAPNTYDVYTYAFGPDNYLPGNGGFAWQTLVTVPGATTGQASVGSLDWPVGGQTLNETYSKHTVKITAGADLKILVEADTVGLGYAALNGVQIVESPTSVATFCTSTPSSLAGCVSGMSGTGPQVSKSAGAGSYTLSAGPAPGGSQAGIFIYSKTGLLGTPVQVTFGWRCIAQVQRGKPDLPGGTPNVCNGQYDWDLGGFVNTTPSLVPGDSLHIQGWYRDPGLAPGALFTNGVGAIAIVP
jgi:hypothetical protein